MTEGKPHRIDRLASKRSEKVVIFYEKDEEIGRIAQK